MQASACIFGFKGEKLTASERSFFREANPVGYILFTRNGEEKTGLRRLTDELRSISGSKVLILTDHEGGRVQRFRGAEWRSWKPPLDQCNALREEDRSRAMWLRSFLIASELHDVGINVNCVPIGDVAAPSTHPILRNRCYSEDADLVAKIAAEVAEGTIAGGVLPVLKHIPGHGRLEADSHEELPVTDADLEELSARDFVPFKALNHLPLGMTAHVLYRSIDKQRPATQSKAVLDIVRSTIGFDGLLMSDDLAMSALSGTMSERSRESFAAGCDVVLHCNGNMEEMQMIAAASGKLAGKALERRDRALTMFEQPVRKHIDELEIEFAELTRCSKIQ